MKDEVQLIRDTFEELVAQSKHKRHIDKETFINRFFPVRFLFDLVFD